MMFYGKCIFDSMLEVHDTHTTHNAQYTHAHTHTHTLSLSLYLSAYLSLWKLLSFNLPVCLSFDRFNDIEDKTDFIQRSTILLMKMGNMCVCIVREAERMCAYVITIKLKPRIEVAYTFTTEDNKHLFGDVESSFTTI